MPIYYLDGMQTVVFKGDAVYYGIETITKKDAQVVFQDLSNHIYYVRIPFGMIYRFVFSVNFTTGLSKYMQTKVMVCQCYQPQCTCICSNNVIMSTLLGTTLFVGNNMRELTVMRHGQLIRKIVNISDIILIKSNIAIMLNLDIKDTQINPLSVQTCTFTKTYKLITVNVDLIE